MRLFVCVLIDNVVKFARGTRNASDTGIGGRRRPGIEGSRERGVKDAARTRTNWSTGKTRPVMRNRATALRSDRRSGGASTLLQSCAGAVHELSMLDTCLMNGGGARGLAAWGGIWRDWAWECGKVGNVGMWEGAMGAGIVDGRANSTAARSEKRQTF